MGLKRFVLLVVLIISFLQPFSTEVEPEEYVDEYEEYGVEHEEYGDEHRDEIPEMNEIDDGYVDPVDYVLQPWKGSDYLYETMISKSRPHTNEHRRIIRSPTVCKIPRTMENGELHCTLTNSAVYCIQTCLFGYTLSEGNQRHMTCDFKENIWKPTPRFEACNPFVDCTLRMLAGTTIECPNKVDKKYCLISCAPYENLPAVSMAEYTCDLDGKWSPELPFCVRPNTGLKLVPRPEGFTFHLF